MISQRDTAGFVGLGYLGGAMAVRLVQGGQRLVVFDPGRGPPPGAQPRPRGGLLRGRPTHARALGRRVSPLSARRRAAEAEVARRGVDLLALPGRGVVAQAVVRRAEVRAALM